MNTISPIIRIVCGLALIIVAATRYSSVRAQVAEGGQIQLFGLTATPAPWQLTLGLGTAILVGLALITLGGFILKKRIQEG